MKVRTEEVWEKAARADPRVNDDLFPDGVV